MDSATISSVGAWGKAEALISGSTLGSFLIAGLGALVISGDTERRGTMYSWALLL